MNPHESSRILMNTVVTEMEYIYQLWQRENSTWNWTKQASHLGMAQRPIYSIPIAIPYLDVMTFFFFFNTLIPWNDWNRVIDLVSFLAPLHELKHCKHKNLLKQKYPYIHRHQVPAVQYQSNILLGPQPLMHVPTAACVHWYCLQSQTVSTPNAKKDRERERIYW